MVFYKGAITYQDFKNMSYIEMYKYNYYASKINQAMERQMKSSDNNNKWTTY